MSKLLAWVKPRAKAAVALVVAGIGAALDAHLLSGTWASLGHVAVAVLTAGAVHQVVNVEPQP